MAAKKNEKSDQFEEKMKRLEEIVALLEAPDVALEKSMELYREGVLCARFCREKLERAKHELEVWREESGDAESLSDEERVEFDDEDGAR